MIPYPRGRDLERDELRRLVADLASPPELWDPPREPRPDQRIYRQLWRDEHVVAWLICWMHDHDTGFHDHDPSAGAVAVAAGGVCEERLVIGGAPVVRPSGRGQTFDFAASDIHRVLHVGDVPAVTLHAYSPPLWRMGAYAVRENGVLARTRSRTPEELYPL